MSSNTTIHSYNITSEDFHKLHPVHYHIFDILKKEIPLTLLQTCREVYEQLIPKIYDRVTITGNNYNSVTGGVNVELEEWYLDDQEAEEDDAKDDWDENLPDLKGTALTHTRFLSFTDGEGIARFIDDTQWCDCGCTSDREYYLKNTIFPNIGHLHLGKKVVHVLGECYVHGREGWDPADMSEHRTDELLDLIFAGRKPHTTCIDWPEDWKSTDWQNDESDDSDDEEENEDWALERGMKNLLLEIANVDCIRNIIVHLQITQLQHVRSKLRRITNNADLILYVEEPKKTNEESSKFIMIDEVWDHFRSLSRRYDIDYIPIRYSIPHSPSLPSSIESLHEGLEEEDIEDFLTWKERLEIRDEGCGCKLK